MCRGCLSCMRTLHVCVPLCVSYGSPDTCSLNYRRACLGAGVVQRGPEGVQEVCQRTGIEEVPQLSCEEPELLDKVSAELRAWRCDALQHLLSSYQVLWARVPV